MVPLSLIATQTMLVNRCLGRSEDVMNSPRHLSFLLLFGVTLFVTVGSANSTTLVDFENLGLPEGTAIAALSGAPEISFSGGTVLAAPGLPALLFDGNSSGSGPGGPDDAGTGHSVLRQIDTWLGPKTWFFEFSPSVTNVSFEILDLEPRIWQACSICTPIPWTESVTINAYDSNSSLVWTETRSGSDPGSGDGSRLGVVVATTASIARVELVWSYSYSTSETGFAVDNISYQAAAVASEPRSFGAVKSLYR